MIKLSVNETKWSSLLARTGALILYILIWIFDFGPEKLPGLSRNGPQVIFRHLCQIRHFCQNRHSPWGHFWHPVWIASLLAFFAILAIACISGHKWVWVPGIQTVTCRSAVKRSTDWTNPAAVKFIEIGSKVRKKDELLMDRSIYESFTAEVLAQSVERVIACSRLRDSRVRWIEKAQTRK